MDDLVPSLPDATPRRRLGAGRAPLAARPTRTVALAVALAIAIGACAQDTSEGGVVEPTDVQPGPADQPGGGGDPTLSGEDGAPGVGGGVRGGDS